MINPWIAFKSHHPAAALKLFCFPYAGGSAAIFADWPKALGPHIDVVAVELPGHGTRRGESPYSTLRPLIDAALLALREDFNTPFAFFGHSLGALISFELARRIGGELGITPSRLVVSGRRAPHLEDSDGPRYNLPEDDFVAELRRLNGTPPEVLTDPILLQMALPVLRADFELAETYQYAKSAPLGCPISAYGGLNDRDINRSSIVSWREHSSGPFTVRMFPGDHFFIHSAQDMIIHMVMRDLLQAGLI